MDPTTIFGLIMGVGMVLALGVLDLTETNDVLAVALPVTFVVIGTFGATLLSVPARHLRAALAGLGIAFRQRPQSARELVRRIVALGERTRRDGILGLEDDLDALPHPLLRKGLMLAIDGGDIDTVRRTLEQEIESRETRHRAARSVLESIARYAPAYGMMGTLAGLIRMLSPTAGAQAAAVEGGGGPAAGSEAALLHYMALALISTFCGLVIANTVALPLADKLVEKSREEDLHDRIAVDGVVAIQSGDNPRIVKEKLDVFLPPEERR